MPFRPLFCSMQACCHPPSRHHTALLSNLSFAPCCISHLEMVALQEQLGIVEDDRQAEAQAKWAAQAAVLQQSQRAAKQAERQKAASLQDWSAEEVRMLEKAIAKYPQGTAKRWEQVLAVLRMCGQVARSLCTEVCACGHF